MDLLLEGVFDFLVFILGYVVLFLGELGGVAGGLLSLFGTDLGAAVRGFRNAMKGGAGKDDDAKPPPPSGGGA